ncbi:MAG: hypothetical protein JSW47_15955, partial [Phycisphaerales bacterium]
MSNRPRKMELPGRMYQKNGRWWWKVRLPGETRVRAGALKLEGDPVAAKTRRVAEEAACDMWRLAIEADAEARITAELKEQTEKRIARVKAKAAEVIAEVERKAKVEASLRIEAERQTQSHCAALERALARANAEHTLRLEAERRARMEAQARSIAEARLEAETELRAETERKATCEFVVRDGRQTVSNKETAGNGRTASCEGCGRANVPEKILSRIDSGQLVC